MHLVLFADSAPAAAIKPIVSETIHLGGSTPEWSIFAGRVAHGQDLRVKFEGAANEEEQTMFIRQDDVKQDWDVVLNGRKLGELFLAEADLVHALPVPPKTLKDGENELQISARTADDILIHSVGIADAPRTNAVGGGLVRVKVADDRGIGLPARLTILDENGSLAALQTGVETNVTARPGVVYTLDGSASFSVRPGTYRIYATRGPEYSLGSEEITVGEEVEIVEFTLSREVNTTNWVASDTHIHTLTYSHHGDALLTERLITLAGEGIELPVATEHNAHSDYLTTAKEMGLGKLFTVVTGNEVTTKRGHFNIFPVLLEEKPVDHKIEHWPDLLGKIRQSRDVRVTILNHPTDMHSGFTPLAATNFNRVTGKNLRGDFNFSFDAIEVVNSGAMRSDWMEPFRCWFALLNRGLKVTGVGASDSHDVSRFIVGQGRTYIQGEDADPAKLNVPQLCDSLKRGHAVVSLGLFPRLAISDAPDALDAPSLTTGLVKADASGPGDLHQGSSKFFEITASVDFARWMNPQNRTVATLYENGQPKLVFPMNIPKQAGKPITFKARFPKPKADAWYVLIAEAPGMTNAYWSIARPYQPSSPEWNPTMIGATNPIYLDANGDGLYSSPRQTALHLGEQYASPHDIIMALDQHNWGVATQMAELLHEARVNLTAAEFNPRIARAAPHVQQAISDYLSTISQ